MAQKNDNKNLDTFLWVGVSARGKKMEGELSGSSIALVKAQLRKQGITPSKVKRKPKPLFGIKSVTPVVQVTQPTQVHLPMCLSKRLRHRLKMPLPVLKA